ncbi:collagen binding domain-containing protein [uncultured Dubosiella sp.]|uniref:MSCRAMM family protein n=1 Tax=uncultured Dubosiella sp. TaxID=1937011 RepID=UPI002592C692|nr:prealbumin-like fold domain-containing protein [uncultured Dubosiella sp.]
MWKKLLMALCVGLALLGMCRPAYASEKKGEMTVLVKESTKVSALPIADYDQGRFVMRPPWTPCDLNEIKSARELDELAAVLKKEVVDHLDGYRPDLIEGVADACNQIEFREMEPGAYLMWSDDRTMAPLIVSIPVWDEEAKTMVFSVVVEPKRNELDELRIRKIDAQTKEPVLGSEFAFTSYEDAACTRRIETVAGDPKTGTASFWLAYDVMYIKETKAPQGYRLSDEVVKVEERNGVVTINGRMANVQDKRVEIDYENEKIRLFVPTGLMTNPGLYASLAVCSAGAIALLLKWSARR